MHAGKSRLRGRPRRCGTQEASPCGSMARVRGPGRVSAGVVAVLDVSTGPAFTPCRSSARTLASLRRLHVMSGGQASRSTKRCGRTPPTEGWVAEVAVGRPGGDRPPRPILGPDRPGRTRVAPGSRPTAGARTLSAVSSSSVSRTASSWLRRRARRPVARPAGVETNTGEQRPTRTGIVRAGVRTRREPQPTRPQTFADMLRAARTSTWR
jgi:hypothetical protein